MKEIKEYREKALLTATYDDKYKIIYPALGLAGESGEVAEKIKKMLRDNNGIITDEIKENIILEIGDVLWYCNALARDLGYTLEEVMQKNIDKLASRVIRNKIHGDGDFR
jgi:NTP pyrophosphatase (non-canonical NTP hydrolase)